jgi:hypothetical protein
MNKVKPMNNRRGKKQNQADKMAWGEIKERFSIMLTPTAAETIDTRAKALGLSRSELLEQMARGMVGVSDTDLTKEDKDCLGKRSENLFAFIRTS